MALRPVEVSGFWLVTLPVNHDSQQYITDADSVKHVLEKELSCDNKQKVR